MRHLDINTTITTSELDDIILTLSNILTSLKSAADSIDTNDASSKLITTVVTKISTTADVLSYDHYNYLKSTTIHILTDIFELDNNSERYIRHDDFRLIKETLNINDTTTSRTINNSNYDEIFLPTLLSKVSSNEIENIHQDISDLLVKYFKEQGHEVALKVFGSCVNGLGSSSSDIDLVLIAPFLENADIKATKQEYYDKLSIIENKIEKINVDIDCFKTTIDTIVHGMGYDNDDPDYTTVISNLNGKNKIFKEELDKDINVINDAIGRLKMAKKRLRRDKLNIINELKYVDPSNSHSRRKSVDCLYEISRLFKMKAYIVVNEIIGRARVGVIKFSYRGIKPCDLIINKEIGTRNSLMIKTYLELDKTDKVRCFVLFIKNYAKSWDVCDSSNGYLSSYSWVMLCIHFLLNHNLLPNLQDKKGETYSDGYDTSFTVLTDLPYCYCLRLQKLSITDLVIMFCDHFLNKVNFETDVITLRGKGKIKSKSIWNENDSEKNWRISIEDPFETVDSVHSHDLGRTVHSSFNQTAIIESVAHLSNLLVTHDLESLKKLGAKWYFPQNSKSTDNGEFDRGTADRGQGRTVWQANGNRGRGNARRGTERREILKDTIKEDLDEIGIVMIGEKGKNRKEKTGSLQCFNCNGFGHIARNCRMKK